MTAVPKPLKFLMPHYEDLTKTYEEWPVGNEKVCASITSGCTAMFTGITEFSCGCPICTWHDARRRGKAGDFEIQVTRAL